MNKQELIKRISELPYSEGPIADIVTVNRNWILGSIEQLDETQEVPVPQFVADWIEKCKVIKKFKASLAYALNSEVWSENNLSDKCIDWLYNANNQEIFARAWLDGYEVEKEKRYLVKIVGMDNINGYLSYNKKLKKWFFGIASESRPYRLKHTRKELEEAGFGWVLDCPGVEVEEVTE